MKRIKAKNQNKVAHVGNLLTTKPHMTPMQIAKEVGCHVTLVYQVRKAIFVKDKVTNGKAKTMVHKAKVKKVVAKVAEVVKEVPKEVGLVEACEAIQKLVHNMQDFCVSFDNRRPTVEILWHDEVYDVPKEEVPLVVDCIRFLKAKEKVYTNTGSHLSTDYEDDLPF